MASMLMIGEFSIVRVEMENNSYGLNELIGSTTTKHVLILCYNKIGFKEDIMSKGLMLKAEAIMEKASIATIANIDDQGYPRASTISNIKTDGVKEVWFVTGLKSSKVKFFTMNNRASVCYCDEGNNNNNNITLIGTVEVLTDPQLKKQLWMDWFINYFPGGVLDPNYCILKFTANAGVFWIDNQYEERVL